MNLHNFELSLLAALGFVSTFVAATHGRAFFVGLFAVGAGFAIDRLVRRVTAMDSTSLFSDRQ
jgi:hypothetical protein